MLQKFNITTYAVTLCLFGFMLFTAAPVFAASDDRNKIILCVQGFEEFNDEDGVYIKKLLKGGTKKSFINNPDNKDVVNDDDFIDCMAMESEDDTAGEGGKMISPMAGALSGLCSSLMPVVSESGKYRLDGELEVYELEWFDKLNSYVISYCGDGTRVEYSDMVAELCWYVEILLQDKPNKSMYGLDYAGNDASYKTLAFWPFDAESYQDFEQVDITECP